MESVADDVFSSLTKDTPLHVITQNYDKFQEFVQFTPYSIKIELQDYLFTVFLHIYVQLQKIGKTFYAYEFYSTFCHNFCYDDAKEEAVAEMARFETYSEAFNHPYIKQFGFSSEKYVIKLSHSNHSRLTSWLKGTNATLIKRIIDSTILSVIKPETPKDKRHFLYDIKRAGKKQEETETLEMTSKNKVEPEANSSSSSTAKDLFPNKHKISSERSSTSAYKSLSKKHEISFPSYSSTSNDEFISNGIEDLHIIDSSDIDCEVYHNAAECLNFLEHNPNSELPTEELLKTLSNGSATWQSRTSSTLPETSDKTATRKLSSGPESKTSIIKDHNVPRTSPAYSHEPLESICPKSSVPKQNSQSNASKQSLDSTFKAADDKERYKAMPDVCFLTPRDVGLTCADIATDGSYVFGGFIKEIRGWDMQYKIYEKVARYQADANSDQPFTDFMTRPTSEDAIVFKGHTGLVNGISYNINKSLLISGSEDTKVKLWSIKDKKCIRTYNYHQSAVIDVCNSSKTDYFASACANGIAAIWNYHYDKRFMEYTQHEKAITCIRFHPNSNYLATGSQDRTVHMWQTTTGLLVRVFPGHKDNITSLSFSPCGFYLTSADVSGTVKVFDIKSNQCVNSFVAFENIVTSVSYNKAGTLLAVTGMGGNFKIYDLNKLGTPISEEEEEKKFQAAMANDNFDDYHPNSPLELVTDCMCKNKDVFAASFVKNNLLMGIGDQSIIRT